MEALLTALTSFFSWVITNMTALFEYVISEPLLLIMVGGMTLTGFVFGIVRRLINIG